MLCLYIFEMERVNLKLFKNTDGNQSFEKYIRFMHATDICEVEDLCRELGRGDLQNLYGYADITGIWCKSHISILLEIDGHIKAALFLNNFPNVPSIPQEDWEPWANNIYNMELLTARNTLWVHLLLLSRELRWSMTTVFFSFLYKRHLSLEFIVFVFPPRVRRLNWLSDFGTIIYPIGFANKHTVQRLLMTNRSSFLSMYKVRKAVVEDNDDVVALIDRYCPEMMDIYGDFYIANMIEHQKTTLRNVIVAEYKGDVVAVMVLSSEINYTTINQYFHLETYNGLKKGGEDRSKRSVMRVDFHMDDDMPSKFEIAQITDLSNTFLSASSHMQTIFNPSPSYTDCMRSESRSSQSSGRRADSDFMLNRLSYSDLDFLADISSLYSDDGDIVSESRSKEEIFFGSFEVDMSCVQLSYTDDEIDRFLQSKRKNYKPSLVFRQKVPHYLGEPNAFAIEIIAANSTHKYAVNMLLLACFECYPEREFCVMSIPCCEEAPPILKKFFRAQPRSAVQFPHELYMCHRLSLLGSISVRRGTKTDIDHLYDLMGANAKKLNYFADLFNTSTHSVHTTLQSFIFTCGSDVIGFAILDHQEDVDFILAHYYCSDVMVDARAVEHGSIKCIVILPIFQRQSRYMMLELHRLSGFTKLYYSLTSEDEDAKFIPSILTEMVPTTPIATADYRTSGEDYWELLECVAKKTMPYSVFMSTPARCALSRVEINTRIVVVGASDVGLSFVISLLFKYNSNYQLHYSNVTLVSTHGICKHHANVSLMPTRSNLDSKMLKMYPIGMYVNVIEGVMTEINRKAKIIRVKNIAVPYDILVLTCGIQHHMPKRTQDLRGKRTENPANVFIINTELDASLALDKLQNILEKSKGKGIIIVYGHSLDAYCCLSALMKLGVPGDNLVFVDPIPKEDKDLGLSSIFIDTNVEEAVTSKLLELGITLHRGVFHNWEFEGDERVKSITFETQHEQVIVHCLAMFAYCAKMVSQTTFFAIHKAGLVFDGALVISPDFQTNDSSIYAAGTFTKYSRRMFADHKRQLYYNQEEVGQRLAEHLSGIVLGDIQPKRKSMYDLQKPLTPLFNEAIYDYAYLPGGMWYLCVRNPGPPAPVSIGEDAAHVLITGNCLELETQGYFRLQVNKYSIINNITCLSLQEMETHNLTNIWGKHERLFNSLLMRYELMTIPDLFTYFQDDQFYAIYSPMFNQLQDEISLILASISEQGNCLLDDILKMYEHNDYQQFTSEQLQLLKTLAGGTSYEKKVVQMFLDFLKDNRAYLPMYAHPLVVKLILAGCETSVFFMKSAENVSSTNSLATNSNVLTL